MRPKLVALYLAGQAMSLVAAGVALFWSAGWVNWWPAWAVMAVWLAWFAAEDIVILRFTPELMAERMAPPREAKHWDRALLTILRLVELARYILAGLDHRYGWTSSFPLAAQVLALAACLLGTGLFVWAMACNPFFSQVVRIQSERGHKLVSGGPYRYVRHPGYTGTILFELALSTLLASWWAIIVAGLCALLLIIRTGLEDRSLRAELDGYEGYTHQVRFRLVPGIW